VNIRIVLYPSENHITLVDKIQNSCEHEFRRMVECYLQRSLVDGLYLGGKSCAEEITLKCTQCSLEHTYSIDKICPVCLGNMLKGSFENYEKYCESWLGTRCKKYFYRGVRLFSCERCSFKMVLSEWREW
jgi:hypothetical protein